MIGHRYWGRGIQPYQILLRDLNGLFIAPSFPHSLVPAHHTTNGNGACGRIALSQP